MDKYASTAPASAPEKMTTMLATAGLVPFLGLTLLHLLQPQLLLGGVDPLDLLAGYSLAIAAFMAGTLWQPDRPVALLALSNLLTVSAWLLVAFRPALWLPAMALVFALIAWAERRWLAQHTQYWRLRQTLTWAVKLCLLTIFLIQWW